MTIYEELRKRGYSSKMAGTWHLIEAVQMSRQTGRLLYTTTELYPALAQAAGTTPAVIERRIRYSIGQAEPGRTNTEVIRELAYGGLDYED